MLVWRSSLCYKASIALYDGIRCSDRMTGHKIPLSRAQRYGLRSLESELLEEPAVLPCLVLLLKDLFDALLGVDTLARLAQCLVGYRVLEGFEFECVTGGHEVVVVYDLQERLDLAPLCELLGSHPLCDFTRVAVYTSDDSMGVWAGLGTLVRSLEDHGFAAGVASREDDADLRDKGDTRRLSVCCTLARYACC